MEASIDIELLRTARAYKDNKELNYYVAFCVKRYFDCAAHTKGSIETMKKNEQSLKYLLDE